MRHFDAHAYRTETTEGVWDFARGCMRTYLILREKAQRFHADAEIQAALAEAMVDGSIAGDRRRARRRRDRRAAARPARPRGDGGARLRARTPRPARDRAPARRALTSSDRAARISESTRRRSRRRSRCATPTPARSSRRARAAPADDAAAQRAGSERVVGRAASDVERPGCRATSTRSRVAGQQHGWSCSTTTANRAAGQALERHRVGARRAVVAQAAAPTTSGRRRCGSVPFAAFTITKLSWLHRTEPDAWARARARLPAARLADVEAQRRVRDRPRRRVGHRLLLGGRERVRAGSARDRRRRASIGAARCRVCSARSKSRANAIGAVVAAGTGDNMAAALGDRARARRRRDLARHVGHGLRGQRDADGRRVRRGRGFADATGRFLPLVCTLNATKVTDAIARLLGVDHAALRRARVGGGSGRGRRRARAVLRRRAHAEPARRDRERSPGLRSDVTRERARARRGRGRRVRPARRPRRARRGAGVATNGRVVLVGGGARSAAFQHVLADLAGPAGRRYRRAGEYVATGACAQAAGRARPADVARVGGPRPATVVEPTFGRPRKRSGPEYAAARG